MTEDSFKAEIRAGRERRAKAERDRAAALSIPDPEPSPVVLRHTRTAEEQRFLARQASDRRVREKYLIAARVAEKRAEAAWEKQLEAHWRTHSIAETLKLAAGRGEKLDDVQTEVADWARDERGALIREGGLPVLAVDRATTAKRRDGLRWLRDKGRLSEAQFRIGMAFREVCSRFSLAEMPGRAEEGGGGASRSTPSAGLADWRLLAVRTYRRAEGAIIGVLPPTEGADVLGLCKAVCHEGRTVRDLAGGDDWKSVRMEERLKLGLALLSQVLKEEK